MKLTLQARELSHALNAVIGGTDGAPCPPSF